MTLSTSYSPICTLNLNSLLVLFLRSTWITTLCTMGVSPPYMQWSIISYIPFNTVSSFIISTKLLRNYLRVLTFLVVFSSAAQSLTCGTDDVDDPQSYPGTSFLSLWYVTFSYWGSNFGIGPADFLSHCLSCFPPVVTSDLVLAPPCIKNSILGPSLHFSTDILCTFWFGF
jgi:hypothetical protein